MRKRELPKTMDVLKALSYTERAKLWEKYSHHPFKRQNRSLWYYIQCDRLGLRIDKKYLVKIKRYKDNPSECVTRATRTKYNLTPGAIIRKEFRGIVHEIIVNNDNTFTYNGEKYRTLSAIAKDISGIKISGPDFFGLSQRKSHDN
jgi:hypothetical protein